MAATPNACVEPREAQALSEDRLRRPEAVPEPVGPASIPLSLRGLTKPHPQLSILVPVYNERDTILRVLDKIGRVSFPAATETIVVDDGSTDGTAEVLRALPPVDHTRVYFHAENRGKGAAVRTALDHARGDIIVIQDADEELEPAELLPMLKCVAGGESDACYGSRFAGDNRRFWLHTNYWANRLLNGLCNLLNGLHLTDMNTCYKMMRRDLARRLELVSAGFAMEPEITTKLARMGVRIVEFPVTYRPRSKAQGKKIRSPEFFRYLAGMFRFRFGRQHRGSACAVPPPLPEIAAR
ncbi:MAG: glycosyltransferase family 2 protein [Phycisphaerae bacterium]